MKIKRRDFLKGCAAATGVLAVTGTHSPQRDAAPARPGGREILPIPDIEQPYPSALYGKDVHPTPAKPLRPPEGAPNVVIILIDDMGFGATSAFGGPINMPTLERVANEGLKYTRFHTTALCSPTRQALLTGRNHHSVGMGNITETRHHRARLQLDPPEQRGHDPGDAAAERLQHGRVRQDAPDAGLGGEHLRALRPLADRRRLSSISTASSARRPTSGRRPSIEGTQPVEPPADPNYHLTPDLVNHAIALGAGAAVADARQAVLRLPLVRRHPRAASRAAGVERQVQGQVRQGLGQAARADAGEPEEAGRRARRTAS